MGSNARHAGDYPKPCRDVLEIVTAEETTIVDGLSREILDYDDIDVFLNYAAAADHDIDTGVVRLVEIIDTLLRERDGEASS
jgi:hypothetical protein